MDEPQSDTKKVTQDVADNSLPAVVASLEMLTVNSNLATTKNKRLIKRDVSIADLTESLNRRCSLKPRKRTSTEIIKWKPLHTVDYSYLEKCCDEYYYPERSLKKKANNLETIHEEKDNISESSTHMSVKRYKRAIQFQETPHGRKYASIEMLVNKLNSAGTESSAVIDSETK
ncbi:uncharacterized protein LOC143344831 [Colletes latitarsis]|uniref:uncharacterized protein LOC143344831 n=1 Tax=Colletes latitarsis TaxID=2605962 RepID=UPI0040356B98